MRRPVIALLAAAASLTAACQSEPRVAVEDSRVQLPVLPDRPGAAYFTLRTNRRPMRLLGVSSPQVGRIELHDSSMNGGMMRMGPLQDRSFDSNGEKRFAPGGAHAMLFDIDSRVRAGGTIRMTFDFDNAPDVTVDVPVRAMGEP